MERKFLISVIVPVYNAEPYLRECLDSVMIQTIGSEKIQLILINDGSSDGSPDICRSYAEIWPGNVICLDKPNSGVSVARNSGIGLAEGELTTFLDADDKWSPDAFAAAYAAHQKHPDAAVISCRMCFFDAASGDHQLNYKYEKDELIDIKESYNFPQLSSSSVFIKTDIVKKYRYFDGLKYSEDFRFINEILLDHNKMIMLKNPVYWYRKRQADDSAMQRSVKDPDYYTFTCNNVYRHLFDLSKGKYGCVLKYLQFCVMYDLRWRFKIPLSESVPDQEERKKYEKILKDLLTEIDDDIILEQKRIALALQLFILKFKHGHSVCDLIEADDNGVIRYGSSPIYDMKSGHILKISSAEIKENKIRLCGSANLPFEDDRLKLYYSIGDVLHPLEMTEGKENIKTYLYGILKSNRDFVIEEDVDFRQPEKLSFYVEFSRHLVKTVCDFAAVHGLDKKNGIYNAGLKSMTRSGEDIIISSLKISQYLKQMLRSFMRSSDR